MSGPTETPQEAARRLSASAIRDGYKPQGLHTYTYPDGSVWYWRIRLKHPETRGKWIRPMRRNGVGYELSEPDFPKGKPLYRLHDLAARPQDCLMVVEGERKADALAKVGVLATTSGAADSAGKADWRPVVGRGVTIWPDNDEPGQRYAGAVADALLALGCTVRVIDVEKLSLPPKGDAVDWLKANPTATTVDIAALPYGEARQRARPGSEEWRDPQPIQAPLHPVPAFDPETLLPESLRGWIMDEADRMPCAPDFIAAAALAELGSLIGARCAIKPKSRDDWLVVPNLWGADVGDPASMKTPAMNSAMKPLSRLIAQAIEEHEARMAAFEAENLVCEAKTAAKKSDIERRIKAALKDPEKGNADSIAEGLRDIGDLPPKAPTLRRYRSNDTTVEKLGELLRSNPHGLLVHRDELVGLISSWDKEGREGDRQFYLEAWDGDKSFDTDRIGRGHILIPNLCVSVFGGIQPDKLTAYLEQAEHALANDGMLQRFQLLVYPDHRAWEWRDRSPDKDARAAAYSVFDVLADFDPVVWGAAPADSFAKFPYFYFDEEAQKVFIEWSSDHRQRRSVEEHPIIAQHLAKYDKLFPALALILHLVECAATGQRGPVTKKAALRAAAWCEYLEAHARRCYGLLADDGLRSAQALTDKVSQGKLADGFTARDVRRNQWRYLTRDKAIQGALDWLEDEGWLRVEKAGAGAQGGRPTRSYRINPKIQKPGKPGGGE